VRAFVQDELSKAINPLGNEINRLKREIADLATAKPQPAGSVLDITKETLTSFERRLSRHAEHLSRLEDRMKRLETKRAR
jgi:chromosome segregation ATPase